MARRWSRKRNEGSAPTPARDESAESVKLDADDDHAWWAQTEVQEAWRPKDRPPAEPKRDILAEHFGADWRKSFEFTPPTPEELAAEAARERQRVDDEDPYKVLDVSPSATWDEIVSAHRHQARVNHPDLKQGLSAEERALGEERIRIINAAYAELRVRRGI